ncbi:hypothetical protein [Candidiatus Paracoxiella cheracis]|uniref:hypothetical protein n=1 Tax=Candidiatus Paracoxiella cheracis TaxID=3405120 RepID=UPI003BF4AEDC
MKLITPAFDHGDIIPDKYSRYYDNLSPHLRWEGEPHGTNKRVAMLVIDYCHPCQ